MKKETIAKVARIVLAVWLATGWFGSFLRTWLFIYDLIEPSLYNVTSILSTREYLLVFWRIALYLLVWIFFFWYAWRVFKWKTKNTRPAIVVNALQLFSFSIKGLSFWLSFGLIADVRILFSRWLSSNVYHKRLWFPDFFHDPSYIFSYTKPITLSLLTNLLPFMDFRGWSWSDYSSVSINLFALLFLAISIWLAVYYRKEKRKSKDSTGLHPWHFLS